MIGIVPFHGVALAELGEREGAPDVSVDTQLGGPDEAPTHFAALASQADVSLDAFSIVKLPHVTMPFGNVIADKEDRLQTAALRSKETDAELALLRERVRRTEDELERSSQKNVRTVTSLTAAESEVERLRGAPRPATSPVSTETLATIARSESRIRELEAALRVADENGIALDVRVNELEAALEKRDADWERELAHVRGDRAELDQAHGDELAILETRLEERGQAVRSLEADVERHALVAKDLVATLEEMRKTLDRQAQDAARRDAELLAREWTILEGEGGPRRPTETAIVVDAVPLQQAFSEQSALVEQLRAELGRRAAEDGSSS